MSPAAWQGWGSAGGAGLALVAAVLAIDAGSAPANRALQFAPVEAWDTLAFVFGFGLGWPDGAAQAASALAFAAVAALGGVAGRGLTRRWT